VALLQLVVVHQRFLERAEKPFAELLVGRVLEVGQQARRVIEFEDRGVLVVHAHQLFVSAAVGESAADLRASNVRDVAVVDTGGGRWTVAVGTFRSEDAAKLLAADLTRQGLIGTAVAAVRPAVSQTMIVVRDPPANAVARLKELQAAYPGADLKVGGCDRA